MPAHLIAQEGPLAGLVLNFEEGTEWIIGRDPDVADLIVEDSTVSRKHVRVIKTAQGLFLQNLSRVNPALVNGEETEDRVLLQDGDRVQIGSQSFVFSESDEKERPAKKTPKKRTPKKPSTGYDDIFGELEEPPPPPRTEAIEEERPFEREYAPPEEEEEPEEVAAAKEENVYDTIFEDLEEPSEIPFHLLQAPALLLKVISGPNAGAEIGIEKGKSYVLGKDSNSCDIVFQDLSVSRNHARLTVSEDGLMELEDLGSKNGTSVNGVLINEKTVVTSQDLIALGTTVFLIIDREAPQETIYSPMLPSYESQKMARASAASAAMESAEVPLEEMGAQTPHWKQIPLPWKHLIIAGSFAAIFLIVFLSFFSLFKSERMEIVRKEPVSEIQEAVGKFKDIEFSFNPGSGKLFITGHVITPVEYQELMYRINQIPFIQNTDNTVVIDELVWKMTNDVLSDTPAFRAVSVHSPKAGKFVASGYVTTAADLELLHEYLTVNFPYLDRLENNVAVEEILNVEIQNALRKDKFGSVSFQLTGGDLILTGGYSSKMKSEYQETVKKLNKLTGIARVKDLAVPTEVDSLGIDITQSYKIGGSATSEGHGYSVVLNGKIYTAGDTVDGMAITAIKQKTILLEKDGLNYRIDYVSK
jgi:type III secretion system YscD/HrpQ family protein